MTPGQLQSLRIGQAIYVISPVPGLDGCEAARMIRRRVVSRIYLRDSARFPGGQAIGTGEGIGCQHHPIQLCFLGFEEARAEVLRRIDLSVADLELTRRRVMGLTEGGAW